MSNKKQTAVDFLINQILKYDKSFLEFYRAEIEQAKEMEKQHIIDAWTDGKYCNTIGNEINYEDGEQYYNENYEI
jgi:hypothetical protein